MPIAPYTDPQPPAETFARATNLGNEPSAWRSPDGLTATEVDAVYSQMWPAELLQEYYMFLNTL